MGRWEAARDLLEATGQDWDRRIFRLQVLAHGAVSLRWAETWANAERTSPDALAMLAHVQALRSIVVGPEDGRALLEQAWRTCHEAAEAWPADPSPWVVLMALLRVHCPDRETLSEVWQEVRARDPYNREAHHELLTYVFGCNHGSATEMHDWAYELTSSAPRGTPIPVLLLVAHAESHRIRMEQNSRSYGLIIHPWLDCPDIDRVLNGWWRYRAPQPHAHFMDDANYLAHALSYANRHAEAFEVFDAIGRYAARLPWAYCGDPTQLFLRHRGWAQKAIVPG